MPTSPEAFAVARRYMRAMAGGPPVWADCEEQPRPVTVREAAPAQPAPATLTDAQFTRLLDRLSESLVSRATPVQESAQPAAPEVATPNDYGYPDDWPNKPLHEYTPDERAQFVDGHLVAAAFNRTGRPPIEPADLVAGINARAQDVNRA